MKTSLRLTIATMAMAILTASTATVRGQFNYLINNGTITITGYTGPGGDVTIPDTINGLPVAIIGDYVSISDSTHFSPAQRSVRAGAQKQIPIISYPFTRYECLLPACASHWAQGREAALGRAKTNLSQHHRLADGE